MECWRSENKDEERKSIRKEKLRKSISKADASQIITKEIAFSQLKNKSKDDLWKIHTKLAIYFNPMLNDISNLKYFFGDFNKDELLTKLNYLSFMNLSVLRQIAAMGGLEEGTVPDAQYMPILTSPITSHWGSKNSQSDICKPAFGNFGEIDLL